MTTFLNDRRVCIILILLISTVSFAGITGKIAGHVTEAETGLPLPGANVLVEGAMLGSATDENGYYAILNIEPGVYVLKISMIGYETVTVRNVKVNMNVTTTIDIAMSMEVLDMAEVVVTAERPLIVRDVSHSQLNIDAKQIETMPVVDVTEVIGLQAGVQGLTIRGSSSRQSAFIIDGFVVNDARSNVPFTSVSLNTVKEVQVQTGGFNAEYGNVRSGIINLVTAEGSKAGYNGAVTMRYRPASSKHYGPSVYDPYSYFNRPYLDPDVCYVGTSSGSWDIHMRNQYPSFDGWNAISLATIKDSDPSNDLTPEGAKRLYEWQHRRQGDIEKPDYVVDVSFGGPVPVVGKALGDLRFYASYRDIREMFVIPLTSDSYKENVGRLKLNADLVLPIPFLQDYKNKLTVSLTYGEIHSASPYQWKTTPTGTVLRGTYNVANYASSEVLYVPGWFSPAEIYRTILGVKLNSVINSRSYFEQSFQYQLNNYNTHQMELRDTSKTIDIMPGPGNYYVDEAPYGYWGYGVSSIEGMRIGGWMNLGRDKSTISTFTYRFDFTKQIDRVNQFKTGFNLVLNNYDIKSFTSNPGMTTWNREQVYQVFPYRVGLYAQDKLEFEGFIANVGLRLDYTNSNSDIYAMEDYDVYYKEGYGLEIEDVVDTEKAKAYWSLSPRLGISHPITANSKLFFNYGHFQTEPTSSSRFRIQREYNGLVTSIGDPNLEMEKTVSYELGYAHNIFDQFLLNISGYYKDITNQTDWIYYENINASIQYSKAANNNYEDIRGFEITLDKRRGRWITGFLNYTYMISSYGYFGLQSYYEDPSKQREYLTQNPYQVKPHPRPYARTNIDFHSPLEFGPSLMGLYPAGGWNINVLATWNQGSFTTYNPNNVPGLINNVQWRDSYNFDLRFTKTFNTKKLQIQLFADISNLLNTKFLSYVGFFDNRDYLSYMASLHFDWEEGIQKGSDRIGVYREDNVDFVAMRDISYSPTDLLDLGYLTSGEYGAVYQYEGYPIIGVQTDEDGKITAYEFDETATVKEYYGYNYGSDGWNVLSKSEYNKLLDNKAYIDMPNIKALTFLYPREIKFGIKIVF
ncbi:MAG: TonB-dependent receptor [Candidatus Marinimicrobia bacterium]|nr:TonB-dependent receptor [Candidatus Neomarinimicrobiota bacterium]